MLKKPPQTYLVWKVGDLLRLKTPSGVMEAAWTPARENDLRFLMNMWQQTDERDAAILAVSRQSS